MTEQPKATRYLTVLIEVTLPGGQIELSRTIGMELEPDDDAEVMAMRLLQQRDMGGFY